ncbi:MAG: HEAT repeat domain-containing protein [Thermomicrobiales bacterium]
MDHETEQGKRARSLSDALAAMRKGDLSQTRMGRLSDLSRDGARMLAREWMSLPEAVRIDIVRRCDELSEDRVELNFRRVLQVALVDPSPVVRQLAVAGLWEDDSRDLMDRLLQILRGDESPDVRAEAASALGRYAQRAVDASLDDETARVLRRDLLLAATSEDIPYVVQRRALESLGPFAEHAEVAATVAEAFNSGDHGLQCSALYAMGRSLDRRWLPNILAELESEEAELRFEAARAAGLLGSADALPLLLEAARDDDAEVRHAAITAFGQIGGRGAVRALERLTEDAGEADLELIDAALEEVNTLLEPFQPSS